MDPLPQILDLIEANGLWRGTIDLKRQEYLKTGGTIDRNIYLITQGALRAFIMEEREEQTIRFGYGGDILVALDSYINGLESDLFIQALKHSQVKWITREDLMNLFDTEPKLQKSWHHILEGLILGQMERERDLLTSSPAERLQRVLARSPRLFQEVPHKYIASYLRMTPETLSRLQKS